MRDTFDVLSVKICDESDRNERFPNMKKSGFVIQIVLPVLLLSAMTTFAQQQTAAPAATQAPPAASAPAIPADAPHAADIQAARQDDGKFDQAYQQMGMTVHRQISQEQWKQQLKATRAKSGPLESRIFQYPNYTTTLKGAPAGQYVLLNYLCTFTSHRTTPETVVMAKVSTGWIVAGFRVE
jgi:hypothetical protein